MAASFSSGDVSISAIGTVAYRNGASVWGFGHPFEGLGRRALLIQDAYVYSVVNNPVNSDSAFTYKLAVPGHTVGALTNDFTQRASSARSAAPPRTIPSDGHGPRPRPPAVGDRAQPRDRRARARPRLVAGPGRLGGPRPGPGGGPAVGPAAPHGLDVPAGRDPRAQAPAGLLQRLRRRRAPLRGPRPGAGPDRRLQVRARDARLGLGEDEGAAGARRGAHAERPRSPPGAAGTAHPDQDRVPPAPRRAGERDVPLPGAALDPSGQADADPAGTGALLAPGGLRGEPRGAPRRRRRIRAGVGGRGGAALARRARRPHREPEAQRGSPRDLRPQGRRRPGGAAHAAAWCSAGACGSRSGCWGSASRRCWRRPRRRPRRPRCRASRRTRPAA